MLRRAGGSTVLTFKGNASVECDIEMHIASRRFDALVGF